MENVTERNASGGEGYTPLPLTSMDIQKGGDPEWEFTAGGCLRIVIVGCALMAAFTMVALAARSVPPPRQPAPTPWVTPEPARHWADVHEGNDPTPDPEDEDDDAEDDEYFAGTQRQAHLD